MLIMTEPINHLDGRSGNLTEVLLDLTDRELDELAVYLTQERDALLGQPSDGRTYGNRYSAYRLRTTRAFVAQEMERRATQHPSPS